MSGFRPILWHLAHVGVYQNYWVLQRCAGQPSINPKYDIYFDPIKTPREEATVLPALAEIQAYLARTLDMVENFLQRAEPLASNRDASLSPAYALDLVLEHELQHQETIAFVMQSLPLHAKRAGPAPAGGRRGSPAGEIFVPAVSAQIGASGAGFAYDNELPQHAVAVAPFFIDRDLTTNVEYAEFVEMGGYERQAWWSAAGWEWKQAEQVTAPLYWSGAPWTERGMLAEVALRDDAPVCHVSRFEAEAYAAFRGKRLPTECEWEVAAAWDPAAGRMRRFPWGDDAIEPGVRRSGNGAVVASTRAADSLPVGSIPVGTSRANESALGMHDVTGNVWQWTSSEFCGYPGFEAYPYNEYSQLWFDGDHAVARGGSWFTDRALGRASFRNFYRRRFRPAFIGIRCARDAR